MKLSQEIWLRSHSIKTTVKVIQLSSAMVKFRPLKAAALLVATKAANHLSAQIEYGTERAKKMRGLARVHLGYEGALECPGRDSQEFFDRVVRGMAETEQFLRGVVPPRVALLIALNNPKTFPLDNIKARLIVMLVLSATAIKKHWLFALLAMSVAANIYLLANMQ